MPPIPAQSIIVQEMYEAAAKSREEPRNYLGMSGIGEICPRKIWYGFRGYSPVPTEGRAAMIFDMGNRVEEAVVSWLRKAGYHIEGQQTDFSAHNGFFRGHCDGMIDGVTSRRHILEIKSANDRKFKAFRDNGIRAVSETYYAQVQCYMGYAGLERAVWVVMNKNTCELYAERAYFNKQDFEALHRKALDIISAQEVPAPVENPFCSWCDFRLWCKSPLEAMQIRKTCGTCAWLDMSLEPKCRHPEHAFPLKKWGISCEHWQLKNGDIPF